VEYLLSSDNIEVLVCDTFFDEKSNPIDALTPPSTIFVAPKPQVMEADTCPHFYKRLGHHVANKKLAKMYCPSRKRSQKRLIVHVHVEPKKCRVLID